MTKTQLKRDNGVLLCFVSLTHNVTTLTVTLLLQRVERLPPQAGVAGDAGETLHVEHLLHGDAAAAVPDHVIAAASAATCEWTRW